MATIICIENRLGGWDQTARVVDTLEQARAYLAWLTQLMRWENRQPWDSIDYPGDCPVHWDPLFIGLSDEEQWSSVSEYKPSDTLIGVGAIFETDNDPRRTGEQS